MQLIDDILNIIQRNSISVPDLAKDTGISQWKFYKWFDKKGSPKTEDSKILEQWVAKNLDKVPIKPQKKSGNAPDFEAKYKALAVDYVELVRVKLHEFNCDDVLRNIEEIQAVLKQVVQQAAQGSAADSKFSASYPKDGSTDSNPEGHS